MEQLSVLYTNLWCLTVASLGFYILVEDAQFKKLLETEAKREYYPLDFRDAKTFQFIKVTGTLLEASCSNPVAIVDKALVTNQSGYIVVNSKGEIIYKFVRVRNKFHSSDWKMFSIGSSVSQKQQSVDSDFVAQIHVNSKWSIYKKDIYFPLKVHRNLNPSNDGTLEDTENVTLSVLSEFLAQLNHSSPYIEQSIQSNSYVKRNQLGEVFEYIPYPKLHVQEDRKLSRVHVKYIHRYKSGFRLQKNSDFQYNWTPNGYLEKAIVQKETDASERIGFIKIEKDGPVKLYINESMLDKEVAITTAFLHYILNF